MKIHNPLQTAALIAIALILFFRGGNTSINLPLGKESPETKIRFVEVVRKAATDRDTLGRGSLGFLVKDGGSYDFVPYDSESRFDKMPQPKLIRITHRGEQVAYSQVYEVEN